MTKPKSQIKTAFKEVPESPYYEFSLKARTSDGTMKEVTRLVHIRVEDLSLSLDCIDNILRCNKVDIADIKAHGSKKNIVEDTRKSISTMRTQPKQTLIILIPKHRDRQRVLESRGRCYESR